ncbi:MAG: KEOPS complex kinase/ATPase Bud32 [Nanoarchaeota archaeon]
MRGAEAIIIEKDDKVIKKRVRKPYRNEKFDELLRKKRTKREAKILKKLRGVVNVPKIFEVKDDQIIMEKVNGSLLKDLRVENKEFWLKLGEEISKIHNKGIIHGDLTTKNIIVQDNKIYFIDFGLSFFSDKIEDKAMDLIVLKDILELENRKEKFNWIIEGYKSDKKAEIIKKIEKIEKRGRYKRKNY